MNRSTGTPRNVRRLTARTVAVLLLALGMVAGAQLSEQRDHRLPTEDQALDAEAAQARAHAVRRRALVNERADRSRRAAAREAAEWAGAQADAAGQRARRADDATARQPDPEPASEPADEPADEPGGSIPASCSDYRDNRATGCALLLEWGLSLGQMPCLDDLWTHESGWDHRARNPSSGAYGIPQALPGSKMAEYGADWETNPATQISWGLSYIEDRYGSPCGAWQFFQSNGWY